MNEMSIFLPVLAHVFLVLMLFILLVIRKSSAVKAKAVDLRETAIDNKAWTAEVVKVSNNIANQFETPVLFYVLCVVTFLSGAADALSIILAWTYVVLRYVHAYIHTNSNHVPVRMKVFAVSLVILLVLLLKTSIQLLSAA